VGDVLAKLGALEGFAGDKAIVGTPLTTPANGAPYIDGDDADKPMWELGYYLRSRRGVSVDQLDTDWEQTGKGTAMPKGRGEEGRQDERRNEKQMRERETRDGADKPREREGERWEGERWCQSYSPGLRSCVVWQAGVCWM
jgi:hypothetical protein